HFRAKRRPHPAGEGRMSMPHIADAMIRVRMKRTEEINIDPNLIRIVSVSDILAPIDWSLVKPITGSGESCGEFRNLCGVEPGAQGGAVDDECDHAFLQAARGSKVDALDIVGK